MRDLRDYSVKDWSRLRPPLHAYKSAIYRTETAVYVRRRADGAEALVARARARNRPAVAISIAYEAPWVIELQIAAAQRHFTDAELVVCDNSKSDDAAHEIAELCRAGQIDYLRLPHNPKKTGSRSHALAINWAYRNLICEVKPACFAFLDHDLIPTSAIEFASLVAHQPIYGHVRTAGHRWFLWAGYCVFDRRYCAPPWLSFSQDWFIGLDTGGANYRRLYRKFDREKLTFARFEEQRIPDPLTGEIVKIEFVDDWIHFTNVGGWDRKNMHDPAMLRRILASLANE